MSGDLRIRAATSEDAAAITSLAFRSKAHWGYSLEFMAACKDELTYTGKMIDAPQFHFYVGETNDRMVGFYACRRRPIIAGSPTSRDAKTPNR